MPWKEVVPMSSQLEFVTLASVPGANVSQVCSRFGISRKTGYKWLDRFRLLGAAGIRKHSTRPLHSPSRTPDDVEATVIALRQQHGWGGRKISARMSHLGLAYVPHHSTVTAILKRHALIDPVESKKRVPFIRFEHPAPNDLWQMDFKGHFALRSGGRCHPLTVLDDHSRFNIVLQACDNEQSATVQERLVIAFQRYGLPQRMLMDNGSPWGDDADSPYTKLTVWLMSLGIAVSHCRPFHPQTQGKDERFHRTLQYELLRHRLINDNGHAQQLFDPYRHVYNFERPHEALDFAVPASRYSASPRCYPGLLPQIEYAPEDIVRRVQQKGRFNFHNRHYIASKAFCGYPIALRPTVRDGVWDVFFCRFHIGCIDEHAGDRVCRRIDGAPGQC